MSSNSPSQSTESSSADRLGSWKAIAAYLKRDVTTVQRWERTEAMPVHRHVHAKRGSVYAFRSELDAWLKQRRPRPDTPESSSQPARRQWIPWVVAVVIALVVVSGWWFIRIERELPNPLADARITPLTDFEGLEQAAAISRDGRYVAFLSDRDGRMDVWLTEIGTGEFRNLTQGAAAELLNPEVRSVAFTPDNSLVTFWTREAGPSGDVSVWAAPVSGGPPRPYQPDAVELDWSPNGKRLIYHTADEGDPTYLIDRDGSTPRQVLAGSKGVHHHFQTWSPDGRYIYLVRGLPPDQTDIWRMTPEGENLERITYHNSRVLYPTFLDARTLLYLATTDDGSGPWLYTFDVAQRTSRRISFGIEQYASLAASADRKRLVASVEHAKPSLWRVPIDSKVADERDVTRLDVPTVGALSPRVGSGFLLYVSAKSDGHAVWKLMDGTAYELWNAPGTRVIGGPTLAPDGTHFAFVAESREGSHLYIADVNRPGAKMVAKSLQPRGSPIWSADGASLIVAAAGASAPQLFEVSLADESITQVSSVYAMNPVRAPDGTFLIYEDADAGPDFVVKAMTEDGRPHPISEIKVPRGARRVVFVPGQRALILLQGEMRHNNFWYIDLESGSRRQLTNFSREFTIRDFDISPDGKEIVFDRRQETSDIALIEISAAR